ncbi:uncharacterized protein J3D65DRAFT_639063 [Phyllosticta citribraziliensis]|uniref:Uncharacterized protein n=1 Tax=Phyllosticta citribraziliensis TaxID=989973 RepID=A0ABR1L5Y1_9PEZI
MHTFQTFTTILAFGAATYGAPVKRRDSTISNEDIQAIEERGTGLQVDAVAQAQAAAGLAVGGTAVQAGANANLDASAGVNARSIVAGAGAAAGLAAVTYSDVANLVYLASAVALNVCTRVELDTLGRIAANLGTGTVVAVGASNQPRDPTLGLAGGLFAGLGAAIAATGSDIANIQKIQAWIAADTVVQVDLDNIARLCVAIRTHAGVVLHARDISTIATSVSSATGAAVNVTTVDTNNLIKIVGAVASESVTQAQLDCLAQIANGLRSNVRYAVAATTKTAANTVANTVTVVLKDLNNLATINAAVRARAITQIDLDNIAGLAASIDAEAHFSTY